MSVSLAPQTFAIALPHGRDYPYIAGKLSDVPAMMRQHVGAPRKCLLITDIAVGALYGDSLVADLTQDGWQPHVFTVPNGEATKSVDHLTAIFDFALTEGIERSTPLLALGGGVVGDLAGFAAASLLRGLPLIHLPTTLIAQVDSSIGGKTGINHTMGKNLIGAFYQPRFICADVDTLQSLPEREWTSGLAEMVKHALIADADLFAYLEENWTFILARDSAIMHEVVPRAAEIKAHVVAQDEREKGLRAILNFGHTFGHAIENVAGYGTFTHGEAVALGMLAALHVSHQQNPDLPLERLLQVVCQIPTPNLLSSIPTDQLIDAMYFDKKMKHGKLHIVLLDRLGHAYVTDTFSRQDLIAAWTFAKSFET